MLFQFTSLAYNSYPSVSSTGGMPSRFVLPISVNAYTNNSRSNVRITPIMIHNFFFINPILFLNYFFTTYIRKNPLKVTLADKIFSFCEILTNTSSFFVYNYYRKKTLPAYKFLLITFSIIVIHIDLTDLCSIAHPHKLL